jgi:hypothetical protein
MMQRFLAPILIFFVAALVFASCKSQKQASKSVSPSVQIDSLAQPQQDTIIIETSVVDTIVSVIEQPIEPLKKDSIIITGVGDIMLGTNFPKSSYLPPNRGMDMLTGVAPIFAGADIVFGNLEGVLLDSGGTQKNCRNPKTCYLFRSPEYMGNRLQEAGFNLLSVANNHAGDFGAEGRANTGKVLDTLKINYAGNERKPFVIFEKDGITYGFAAFSPNKGTPQINDTPAAKAIVSHLDSLVDIIIVSFHGGAEGSDYTTIPREHEYFYGEDRGDVYKFAHALIDAGADIIFGHGPHVPRAIEVYKERFIAYSLGNFATYARFNLRGVNGLAPIAKIMVNNKGKFLTGQIISARQTGWGIPEIDLQNTASKFMRDLTKKDMPEVKISIDESGFISYLHP